MRPIIKNSLEKLKRHFKQIGKLKELKDYLEFKKNDKKIELKEGEDYVKDEIKLKILNELKNAKLRKGKRFGIIPYIHITFNPSYEEFFWRINR